MALNCEDFRTFQQQPPKIERVDVPEMDGDCFIRVISGTVRDAYNESINDGERRDLANLSSRLVVLCLCDDGGQLLFPDATKGALTLGGMPTTIVERLFHQCRKLNGIGADLLEEAVKNSVATDESDSSSDSPDP